ncbi:uncharacterized protein CTHT_0074360 [Thermochaetoides thermophila DSM 1495]|uniref:Uncharacterized protein n=1 Tax=Chaetomium thermophilum (strain DSM 1495 / CBS 144.50 / IMI 039719) TaxID=759272 RepID=G0SI36_CHATD|nr:hypothetical protein CTHT_0074360 [Thermochaetoides thermophila DSM 1495]EGS17106.1 hypothetical protein CTHT_0074360 [Thermochaetoides thermophila DSM 1495]
MADIPALHRCPVCFKTYKRREHLQRHRSSHTSERPHRCLLCSASFQRSDVLKRHLQTCDGASTTSSSSRRRACDRCVRQKKACNSAQPCHNCIKRAVECVYSNATPTQQPSSQQQPQQAQQPSLPQLEPQAQAEEPSLHPQPTHQPQLETRLHAQIPHQNPQLHPQLHTPALSHSHPYPQNLAISPPETDFRGLKHEPLPETDLHHGPTYHGSTSLHDPHSFPLHPPHVTTSLPHPGSGHLLYDDHLDVLVQHAVSQFPIMPDDWLGMDFSHVTPPLEYDPIAHEPARSEGRSEASESSDYRGYSFNFLYDFTSRTGLVSSFDCGTLGQREQIVAAFDQTALASHYPEFIHSISTPSVPPALSVEGGPADHGLSSWNSWLHNPIVIKLQQVVVMIKSVVTIKHANSSINLTWSAALEQRCLDFSPHPGSPSSLSSTGACVSPDPIDNEDAKMLLNCVEEMVFTDDDFCRDIDSPVSGEDAPPVTSLDNRRRLQALQAAYIVCLYQNWEGTDAAKRRIRRHRFGTVISVSVMAWLVVNSGLRGGKVARDLGIDTARHLDYSKQHKHDFSWLEYVVREERIRLFIWIFLIDTAFVIFNNLPHRMVIKEMKMHMASPEACFQAATAEECLEQIHRWMHPETPFYSLLLRDAIEHLCLETMTPETHRRFAQLGPVNLFAMVSAIHYIIFQQQNSFTIDGQLVPIRNGLKNWIEIWERYLETPISNSSHGLLQDDCLPPDVMWRRVGFVRYSAEYWLLGSLLTDRIAMKMSPPEDEQGIPETSPPGALPSSSGPRSKPRSVEPILNKYDQTSMRQVNDLITDFKRFHVG